jgi:hypothetical protein
MSNERRRSSGEGNVVHSLILGQSFLSKTVVEGLFPKVDVAVANCESKHPIDSKKEEMMNKTAVRFLPPVLIGFSSL